MLVMMKPQMIDGLLWRHVTVDNVANELSMSFSLMVPAHDSEDTQETLVVIHSSRAQRMERQLARPIAIRV
jgi:hypothetical protein